MSANIATSAEHIRKLLDRSQAEIARALPKHLSATRLARIALTECRTNPKLLECAPLSLIGAIIKCAQLGLEPGGILGQAYLVPFKSREGMQVQVIVGYKGMIDLVWRSGMIVSMETHCVFEKDTFRVRLGLHPDIVHEPNWTEKERGEMTLVYGIVRLAGGGVQFEVMSRAEIEKIRDSSQSHKIALRYNKPSIWATSFEEMARKTVIRRMFKSLPVSIELRTALSLDEYGEEGVSQNNELIIDAPAPSPAKPNVLDNIKSKLANDEAQEQPSDQEAFNEEVEKPAPEPAAEGFAFETEQQ